MQELTQAEKDDPFYQRGYFDGKNNIKPTSLHALYRRGWMDGEQARFEEEDDDDARL